jgi:SNW domain-containing protein 1
LPRRVNPDAKQRIIRVVEAQVDPMEPPKHRIKKVPRGGGSPPVPVLHSPPRSLTVKDQQAWKIPPCVSNWKNARGYTIPLDKRLAADGRGLQDVTINNKFASLSESLYIAERKAAEDLRIRNQIRKRMAMKEKEDKEKELRDMASKARMERAGILSGSGEDIHDDAVRDEHQRDLESDLDDDHSSRESDNDRRRGNSRSTSPTRRRGRSDSPVRRGVRSHSQSPSPARRGGGRGYRSDDSDHDQRRPPRGRSEERNGRDEHQQRGHDTDDHGGRYGETDEEKTARLQRERLRIERRKERERELRLENMKGTMRKNKIDRDMNRDVSEKIALGMHKGSGQLTGEAMYDARLFNQSGGMDSGFGTEDEYNTYSKPLFDRQAADSIYRPKKDDSDIYGDVDTQVRVLHHSHVSLISLTLS